MVRLAYRNPGIAGTLSLAVDLMVTMRKAATTFAALQCSDSLWTCVLAGLLGVPPLSQATAEP